METYDIRARTGGLGRRGEFEEAWHFDRTRRGGEGWRKLGEASCEATERQNGQGSERWVGQAGNRGLMRWSFARQLRQILDGEKLASSRHWIGTD